MTPMPRLSGKFIVLEGGEASGKSTQLSLLRQRIESLGTSVVSLRDPGATHIGEQIRSILLSPDHHEMSMRCEMLLYMASRAQLMKQSILPALAAGACVLCDRFVSSTLAYQAGGDGLTAAEIISVGEIAIAGRWPDLTILLDMTPEIAAERRIGIAKDRIERRSLDYHRQVRNRYLEQAAADPDRFMVVNAAEPLDTVHEAMWSAVVKAFPDRDISR
jgi:dTMP kinase